MRRFLLFSLGVLIAAAGVAVIFMPSEFYPFPSHMRWVADLVVGALVGFTLILLGVYVRSLAGDRTTVRPTIRSRHVH